MSRLTFLVTVITLTCTGVILASGVKSQSLKEVKISVDTKGTVLKDILTDLEKKSGFSFVYSPEVGNISNVRLSSKTSTLYDVLKEIAQQKRLRFNQSNYLIAVVKSPPPPVPPKPGKISGKVLDDKGESLPGVTIKVIEIGGGTQTAVDGSYTLNLPPGIYTLEISYMSFATQRITGVIVTEDKNTPLDIAMKPDTKGLKEVVITSSYQKASVEGLLTRQKNASEISNGISADQISRTPDKNIGESLKRISGVSTVDNKFVIVRGIGERYNSAMLDGVILPSVEAQTRNFSFDLIPSNLVDNVVVSKTVTPDMNASFGGGLIQINTKDIPNENFMSFTAGTSYNDQSTGKDFLSHKRGKYDYFGFDDGRRDFPEGLQHTDRGTAPNITLTDAQYQKKVDDQSLKFTNDNFTVYKYKAMPSQNYQFTIGRILTLDTTSNSRLGFTGSLSYRNTQSINEFDQQRRSDWNEKTNNYGASYGFNTTLGALLNVGLQLGKNRFSLRNTYTHLYDNTLVRTIGYDNVNGGNFIPLNIPNRIQEIDDPTFTDLLQNKLGGQHQLGIVKVEWNVAKVTINRQEKDIGIATSVPLSVGSGYNYFYYANQESNVGINPISRQHYHNKEGHYSWNLDATFPFSIIGIRNSVKAGYFGTQKKATFDWQIAALISSKLISDSLRYIPVSEMINQANFGAKGYNYLVTQYYLDAYEGKSRTHAGYLMFDSRLMEKLRMVWGARAEYYKYTEIKNGVNVAGGTTNFKLPEDKAWQWLPSANLTYSPTNQINIRAAASSSVVRPELMDNSQFFKYNPILGALFGNQGLASTRINSYDLKTEWFLGLGEVISVGAFYKDFKKPIELTFILVNGNNNYYLKNADNAKVYGLEFELRKSLRFINDNKILSNLVAYGNLTLQRSEVAATYKISNPVPGKPDLEQVSKQKRPMYGQSPYLLNAGLQFTGERLGLNVSYNKSGYKTYVVSSIPNKIEFEKARGQLDAQVSYKFLKKRLEVRLNVGNLLNEASVFYNSSSYEANPDYVSGTGDISNAYRLKPDRSNNYQDGDQIVFRQKFGRTISTSLTYNF